MQIRRLNENKYHDILDESVQPISESSLNRLMRGHDKYGYAILSASRNENTTQQNNTNFERLKKEVSALGYSYVPVFGGYKEETSDNSVDVFEKSLFVVPTNRTIDPSSFVDDFDAFQENIIDIANDFDQESVLFKSPNGSPVYYYCKEQRFGRPFSGQPTVNDVTQQYFTSLKQYNSASASRRTSSPQRYTFKEAFISKQPSTLNGAYARSMAHEIVYYGRNKL